MSCHPDLPGCEVLDQGYMAGVEEAFVIERGEQMFKVCRPTTVAVLRAENDDWAIVKEWHR